MVSLDNILSQIEAWKDEWHDFKVDPIIRDVTQYFENSKSRLFRENIATEAKVYALVIRGNDDKPAAGMFSKGEKELLVGRLLCDSHYKDNKWSSSPVIRVRYQDTGTLLFRKDIPYARVHDSEQIKQMMIKEGLNPEKDLMILFLGGESELVDRVGAFRVPFETIQEFGKDAYLPENARFLGYPQHPEIYEENRLLVDYVHSQQSGFGTNGMPRDAFIW